MPDILAAISAFGIRCIYNGKVMLAVTVLSIVSIIGLSNLIQKSSFFKGGIIMEIFFLLAFFLLIIIGDAKSNRNSRSNNYHAQNDSLPLPDFEPYNFNTLPPVNLPDFNNFEPSIPVSLLGIYPQIKPQPRTFYHGTKLEKALEIYNTGLWMVGDSKPRAVWLSDKIATAKNYAGKDGAIVVVSVDSSVALNNRSTNAFIYEIPGAEPYQEYYKIDGIKPTGVLDASGNTII